MPCSAPSYPRPRISSRVLALLGSIAILILGACSTPTPGSNDGPDGDAAFPAELAVASPLKASASGDLSSASSDFEVTAGSGFETFVSTIADVLAGTVSFADAFDPALLMSSGGRAECYGPQIDYRDHPNASGGEPDDGTLPGGDVGLWLETEGSTGEACAAAQLNARMSGVEEQALGALTAMAGLVAVALDDGMAMPGAGEEIDVTAQVNAAGEPGVTFESATIGRDASGDAWTYRVEMTIDGQPAVVELEHQGSGAEYEGILYYRTTAAGMGGNCPDRVTLNGSLSYAFESGALRLEMRTGGFCGVDVDGRDGNGEVDPAAQYPADADGWGDNFDIFRAEFDTSDLSGNYVYAWQAGAGDSHSRIFNLIVADGGAAGHAFFGYGDEIATTDGSIRGFICNWAGPGHSKFEHEAVQSQEMELSGGMFVPASGGSDIGYAPTDECSYDGSGTFVYDTNADGDLGDEVHAPVASGLLTAGEGQTAEELVAGLGFTLPTAP